jgi:RHS repeat-associated protein
MTIRSAETAPVHVGYSAATSAPVTATVSPTSNQIVSAVGNGGARALSYLPGGALAEDQSATGSTYLYGYNASKRLAKVQVNPAAPTVNGLYAYDYEGRRVWRQNGNSGAETAYVYDEAGHVLAEANTAAGGGGATAREYLWLDDALIGMPIYVSGNPVPRFVTTGQIDDPQIVTLTSQAISWNGYTDPFGYGATFVTPTNLLNLRYPGQWFQGETSAVGLSQNGFRDYDPSLGRYIETDPLGIEAGADLYSYVDGDPVNEIDPEGLQQAIGYPALIDPLNGGSVWPNLGDFRWFGCYGGPNWNNCEHRSEHDPSITPNMPGYHGPEGDEDRCYQRHDICMHYCPGQATHGNSCKLNCDSGCYRCLGYLHHQSITSVGARLIFSPIVSPVIH